MSEIINLNPSNELVTNEIKEKISIIIFDWDNTLFPTTEFQNGRITMEMIKSIDQLICFNLMNAGKLAIVKIVTNAHINWIEYLLREFLPNTKSLIESTKISVISAVDDNLPDQWMLRKVKAFQTLVCDIINQEKYKQPSYQDCIFQIIGVGDTDIDVDALEQLRYIFPNKFFVKNIRLESQPTIDRFDSQIRNIIHLISYYYTHQSHLNIVKPNFI